MKKIRFYILSLIFTGLILGSCSEDFLDKTPKGEPDIANFYQTEADAKMGINAAYGVLQQYKMPASAFFYGDICSDDAEKGSEGSDMAAATDMKEHTMTASNLFIGSWRWVPLFDGVFKCNIIIDKMPGISSLDDDLRDRMIGEAKFLRAYYFFELVRTFGGVPLVTEPLTTEFIVPRATKEETYAQIEKDLTEAIPVLWKKSQYEEINEVGRATIGAAKSLLGKVYLYQQKWSQAEGILKDVVTSSEYSLEPDFAKIFSFAGENGSESIFEVNYMEEGDAEAYDKNEGNFSTVFQMTRGGWGWGFNQPTHDLVDEFGTYRFRQESYDKLVAWPGGDAAKQQEIADKLKGSSVWNSEYNTYEAFMAAVNGVVGADDGEGYKLPILVNSFQSKDPRYTATIIEDGEDWEGEIQDNHSSGDNTGYFSRKNGLSPSERPAAWRLSAKNERVIRLADVYLMYAEAACENGNLAEAKTYLNKIRERARNFGGDPTALPDFPNYTDNEGNQYSDTQDGLRKAIRTERRLELAMEHHRLWDVIRWGLGPQLLPNFTEGVNEIYPIPQHDIDVAGLKQNPGY